MRYDPSVLRIQVPLSKWFIYHLIYHRVISLAYKARQMQNEFCTLTSDAHLLNAAVYWCMVFGTDSNTTHWKQLLPGKSHAAVQSFRQGLLEKLSISEDSWRQYWESMKDFRDKYAAHRELRFTSPIPNLDIALDVVFYYDQWVRTLIFPDTIEEPSLKSFAQSLQKSTVPFIAKLMEATAN